MKLIYLTIIIIEYINKYSKSDINISLTTYPTPYLTPDPTPDPKNAEPTSNPTTTARIYRLYFVFDDNNNSILIIINIKQSTSIIYVTRGPTNELTLNQHINQHHLHTIRHFDF